MVLQIRAWSKLSKSAQGEALKKDWYVYYSFRHPKTHKLVRLDLQRIEISGLMFLIVSGIFQLGFINLILVLNILLAIFDVLISINIDFRIIINKALFNSYTIINNNFN